MARFTNKKDGKTIEITLNHTKDHQDVTMDVLADDLMERDRILDAYVVDDVDWVIDAAKEWAEYKDEITRYADEDEIEAEREKYGERQIDWDVVGFPMDDLIAATPLRTDPDVIYAVIDRKKDGDEFEERYDSLEDGLLGFHSQWGYLTARERRKCTLTLVACKVDEDDVIDWNTVVPLREF